MLQSAGATGTFLRSMSCALPIACTRLAAANVQSRCLHARPSPQHVAQGLDSSQNQERQHLQPERVAESSSTFPPAVWSHISSLLHQAGPPTTNATPSSGSGRAARVAAPHALNIGCGGGGGAGCVSLARAGARVTGIDDDQAALAHATQLCTAAGAKATMYTPHAAMTNIPAHSAHLALVAGAGEGVLRPRLQLAHRLLAPQGRAVVVWNDRDLSHPLVAGFEALLESASAGHVSAQLDSHYRQQYMVIPTQADLAAAGAEDDGRGGCGVSGAQRSYCTLRDALLPAHLLGGRVLGRGHSRGGFAASGVAHGGTQVALYGGGGVVEEQGGRGVVGLPYCRHDEQHAASVMIGRLEGMTQHDGTPLFCVVDHKEVKHTLHLPHPPAHTLLDAVLRQSRLTGHHAHDLNRDDDEAHPAAPPAPATYHATVAAANGAPAHHRHYSHHAMAAILRRPTSSYSSTYRSSWALRHQLKRAAPGSRSYPPTLLQAASFAAFSNHTATGGGEGGRGRPGVAGGLAGVRAHLAASSSNKRKLLAALQALVDDHGSVDEQGRLVLPLITRMYVLAPGQ